MKCILVFFSILISTTSFAEKILVANCSEGKGCTFELTDIESDLMENDFGRPINSNDKVVLGKKKDGTELMYLDDKTREAIDKEWGGDGHTQIGLFNPHTQPTDGLWKLVYGTSTGNDCYGIGNIGNFIRKSIAPGKTGDGNINFQNPFNPSQLFPSNDMRWVKSGHNTYKGILDFASNNIGGMKMYYHITIVTEKKIESVYTIEIKVPAKGTCVAKIPVTFSLLKAKENDDGFPDEKGDDDLLPVHPKGKEDDLLDVKPKDDLLPVESDKTPKTKVERLDQAKVDRIEE